jgi:hypothetical protein
MLDKPNTMIGACQQLWDYDGVKMEMALQQISSSFNHAHFNQ